MSHYKTDRLDLRLGDCMDLMRDTPDGFYDLAIADPPYGIGESSTRVASRGTSSSRVKKPTVRDYGDFRWDRDPMQPEYFAELQRVSKNQIIWGANHFIDRIPGSQSPCWVVWDKRTSGDFADCELAWTSFKTAVRKFEHMWNGAFRDSERGDHRIHPTQKPVALYRWLLANYAKPGMRILDTHLGSGSHAIAAHYAGVHLTATEIDPDYFAASVARIKRETQQVDMFTPPASNPEPERELFV